MYCVVVLLLLLLLYSVSSYSDSPSSLFPPLTLSSTHFSQCPSTPMIPTLTWKRWLIGLLVVSNYCGVMDGWMGIKTVLQRLIDWGRETEIEGEMGVLWPVSVNRVSIASTKCEYRIVRIQSVHLCEHRLHFYSAVASFPISSTMTSSSASTPFHPDHFIDHHHYFIIIINIYREFIGGTGWVWDGDDGYYVDE